MDNVCPVAKSFLATVRSLYDFDSMAYESLRDLLEILEERAAFAGGSRTRQHQRAFFSIEAMLAALAPRLAHNVIDVQHVTQLVWPRTREGLTGMLKVLNNDQDNLLGMLLEYTYTKQWMNKGIEEMTNDNQRRLVDVYKLARESSVILRQSLKNSDVTLTRVGKRLALAAHTSRFHVSDMLYLAEVLLQQDEQKVVRAWELPPPT